MDEPSAEDVKWLTEVKNVLGKKLPKETEKRLIALGLIEQKLGGFALTAKGQLALQKSRGT